jgi:AcrR family transcriptional regulator
MSHQSAVEDEGKRSGRMRAIIQSAYTIMGRKGFVNVSLADIAEEAGISKALLHYYFKDKDELVGEIYTYTIGRYFDRIAPVYGEPLPLAEKINRIIDVYYDFLQENPEWFVILMELTILGMRNPKRRQEIFSQHVQMRDATAELFKKAKDGEHMSANAEEKVLASIMMAMANGFAMSHLIAQQATDLETFIAYFKEMILEMAKRGYSGVWGTYK